MKSLSMCSHCPNLDYSRRINVAGPLVTGLEYRLAVAGPVVTGLD